MRVITDLQEFKDIRSKTTDEELIYWLDKAITAVERQEVTRIVHEMYNKLITCMKESMPNLKCCPNHVATLNECIENLKILWSDINDEDKDVLSKLILCYRENSTVNFLEEVYSPPIILDEHLLHIEAEALQQIDNMRRCIVKSLTKKYQTNTKINEEYIYYVSDKLLHDKKYSVIHDILHDYGDLQEQTLNDLDLYVYDLISSYIESNKIYENIKSSRKEINNYAN